MHLPASVSQSLYLSNLLPLHSFACPFRPSAMSPRRRVISAHLRMTPLARSCLSKTQGPLSSADRVIVPLKGPADSFARRLFDRPSQEGSSLSFIWLNCYASFLEGDGMSDTSLNDLPPFLLPHLLCVCQLFSSPPPSPTPGTHPPFSPSRGHRGGHQTPVGCRFKRLHFGKGGS